MKIYRGKKLYKKETTLSGDKGEIWRIVSTSKYGKYILVQWKNEYGGTTEIFYESIEDLEGDFEERIKR